MMELRMPQRRTRLVLVLLAFLATLTLLTACLSSAQSKVLSELNQDRRAHGAKTLSVQRDAQRKAQAWAEKLARENRLYHSTLSSGIGVRWCSLGENVGSGPTVGAIQHALMRSSGHRANVLGSKWNGVGVGYAKNGDRTFTVQVFIRTC